MRDITRRNIHNFFKLSVQSSSDDCLKLACRALGNPSLDLRSLSNSIAHGEQVRVLLANSFKLLLGLGELKSIDQASGQDISIGVSIANEELSAIVCDALLKVAKDAWTSLSLQLVHHLCLASFVLLELSLASWLCEVAQAFDSLVASAMFAWCLASQVVPAGNSTSNSERLDHLLGLAFLVGALKQRQLLGWALLLVLAPLFKRKTSIFKWNLGKGEQPAEAFSTTTALEVDEADLVVLAGSGAVGLGGA